MWTIALLLFSRIIQRDVEKRGHEKEYVQNYFYNAVIPTYLKYINPTKKNANLIINTDNLFS